MKFEQSILENFQDIFNIHNLIVSETSGTQIRLQSERIKLDFIFNVKEMSFSIFLGRRGKNTWQLTNQILEDIFKVKIEIENNTLDNFIKNAKLFFEDYGFELLEGKADVFDRIAQLLYQQSIDFTQNILDTQNLKQAELEWQSKNYDRFIFFIDKLRKESLPESILKRYEIALKRR